MTEGVARPRIGRLVVAGIAAGFAGGAAAGLGARLIMFAVRLDNPAFNGATTHAGYVNGQWSPDGTLSIVIQGMFVGLSGVAFYFPARRFLGGRTAVRGLLFGLLVLACFGGFVLDGSYEYSRFVSPAVSVAAFAALHPLYGVIVAVVADAIAPMGAPRLARWRLVGVAAVAVVGLAAGWQLVRDLRFRYGF